MSGDPPHFRPPDPAAQVRMVEAILFASAEPLSTEEIEARMPMGADAATALRRLEVECAGRGVVVVRINGKWAMRTAPDLAFVLRREAQETRKLSRAAIETLAIIAYHQPSTRAEIEEIRGVSVSAGTLDLLMEAGWVKLGRRRETPGRPTTFVTTEAFLDHFSLESVRDLPGLAELKAAGMLASRPPPGALLAPEDVIADEEEPEEDEDGSPTLDL